MLLEQSSWPPMWESLNLYAGEMEHIRAYAASERNAGRAVNLAETAAERAQRAVDRAGARAIPRDDAEPIEGGITLAIVLGKDDPTPAPLQRVIEEEVVSAREQISQRLDPDAVLEVVETVVQSEEGVERSFISVEYRSVESDAQREQVRQDSAERVGRAKFNLQWDELSEAQQAEIFDWMDEVQQSGSKGRRGFRDILFELITPELLQDVLPLGLTREQAAEILPTPISRDVRWVMIRPSPERAWRGLEPTAHAMLDGLVENPVLRALAKTLVPVVKGIILDQYGRIVSEAAQSLELRARGIDNNSVGIRDPFRKWVDAAGKRDGGSIFSSSQPSNQTAPGGAVSSDP